MTVFDCYALFALVLIGGCGVMTDKMRRFVDAYFLDRNATRAALQAGYSPKTAYSSGNRLLKNVEVAQLIEERERELSRESEITVERIVSELGQVAFAELGDVKVADKLKSLELLGKYLGMFRERVEQDVKLEFVLPDEVKVYAN